MGLKNWTRPAISEAKQLSQLKLAANALHEVLCGVFGSKKPADRILAGFFRAHPRCGSRDRRVIGEAVYAVLRNWGFLRLGLKNRASLESGTAAPSSAELHLLIARGGYLSNLPFPAARLAGVRLPSPAGQDSLNRARALMQNPRLDCSVLLPEWVASAAEPEFPLKLYAEKLSSRPPMWLRMQTSNREKLLEELTQAGLAVQTVDAVPDALAILDSPVNLYTLDAYRDGRFEVQDLASQCIGLAASPSPGERWLDACAGAGGKTLQLAQQMERKGSVIATDIREYKLEDLRKRARRAGFPNIQTRAWDGKILRPRYRESFDGVLVDAPCSCSGVWRRNPDGVWNTTLEEVLETAALQSEILDAASIGVKPGGVLVYATCSILHAENRAQTAAFLARHPEFVPERFPHPLNGTMTDGTLLVTPEDADCDSMFVARFRKLKGKI